MTVSLPPEPKSTVAKFADDLNDAVRKNPAAAALIGLGAIWLFAGSSRLAVMGTTVATGAKHAGEGLNSSTSTLTRAVSDHIATAADAAGNFARTMKDGVAGAISSSIPSQTASNDTSVKPSEDSKIVENASGLGANPTAGEGNMLTTAHKNLTKTLERQPIMLGGIGLCIGAGIAAAFALSQTESDMLGDAAADMRSRLAESGSKTLDTALNIKNDALEAVSAEAQKQGLTADNVRKNLQDVGDKLKTVVSATQEAVKQRL